MKHDDSIREVAERVSIVDLVGEYVALRRSGSNYLGLCPFHNEKTPSFNVNPAREIFHCFGCGAGGDIYSFLMKIEGLSFPEALRKLAARAGVTLAERPVTEREREQKDELKQQYAIMQLTARFYRDQLLADPQCKGARGYLERRQVSSDISAAFGLGAAPPVRNRLISYLRNNGYRLELAEKLGIVRNGEHGWYELLHNRLIFPIRDRQGQPIGFAGRALDDTLPKYINSPESPLYKKSNVFFGIDLALREIRQSGTVIVVEGYFDHLTLFQNGVKNVLATCGTALTESHITLLKKHAERVCLLFDSDKAGRAAAVRGMELCLEQSLPSYIITLPEGDDPDSFLQMHGAESFNRLVTDAKPSFEQFLHWLLAKTAPDSVDQRVRLMDQIVPRFNRIRNPIEQDLYQKEICRLLNIDPASFRRRLAGERAPLQRGGSPVANITSAVRPVRKGIRLQSQETLLGLVALYPEVTKELEGMALDDLFDQQYLPLARVLFSAVRDDGEGADWRKILAQIEDDQLKSLAASLFVQHQHLADIDWKVALQQCLARLKAQSGDELKKIAMQLAMAPAGSPEQHELLKRAEQLRNQKSEL